jgi:hypothetical protein
MFVYKEGQASWGEVIESDRKHESIQSLLGHIDENLIIDIFDKSLSNILKKAFKLYITETYAAGSYEYFRNKAGVGNAEIFRNIGKSSINDLLKIPKFEVSHACAIYEYYAQLAAFVS